MEQPTEQELQDQARAYFTARKSEAYIVGQFADAGVPDRTIDAVLAAVISERKSATKQQGKRLIAIGLALLAGGFLLAWLLAGWRYGALAYALPIAGAFTLLKGAGTMVKV